MPATPSTMIALGTAMPSFDLPVTNAGPYERVASADLAENPVLVMFICNHCPFVKHICHELAKLGNEYAASALQIIAINSNDITTHPDDAPDKMAQEAASAGYTFPYAFDESQQIAHAFGAACTPDFFLYDANHSLAYRGQLDGSRPNNGIPVTGEDLRAAINAVLAGKAAAAAQIPSIGCNIKWKPGNEPD
ncbi:MAG: thioredoxin family protein [Phycisphaeraceae bacterium]|nr:thioredoxin family protein [Phycisphaerales bacterium]MCB9860827.1 thioredoxin family protein [Phycisphaeraceae bacterium]